jgi:hypothetical protein
MRKNKLVLTIKTVIEKENSEDKMDDEEDFLEIAY